ncbi:MAG: TonB-dependent receptor, partial [Eudoraea sp.]|nr:TonB-dependent receptor [Eudoraea sp.]
MYTYSRNQFRTRPYILLCLYLFLWQGIVGQETVIKGIVLDRFSRKALSGVYISVNDSEVITTTNDQGIFEFTTSLSGNHILHIKAHNFVAKQYPLEVQLKTIDLGEIILERDLTREYKDDLIALTEVELADDNFPDSGAGLLQATRDIFLRRAAFDFGQVFFKVRGYDSRNGMVLLNGIPMNDLWDGRPQWNHWGGLNDITRNQEFAYGLEKSATTLGGLLGSTNIDMRPSKLRPGIRVSSSVSNRTYRGRVMATYNTGLNEKGWAFSFSASRRLADEGYMEGTLYDAYSMFSALEYNWNQKHQLGLTAILTSNRRGRSSAITEEVFTLLGSKYNPYWGWQEGKIRNSRVRLIRQPMVMMNYVYNNQNFQWSFGMAYQWGSRRSSRIGYYNAPNPDPTYYRNMPSYYVNSPIGANFINASIAEKGLLNNPQWPWEQLYTANTSESKVANAAYILYDDVNKKTEVTMNLGINLKVQERFQIDAGITHRTYSTDNFAQISDLLGAQNYLDRDPFS